MKMPHNGNEAVDNIFGATCNKIHDYDQKIEKHSILFLKKSHQNWKNCTTFHYTKR